MLMDIEVGPYDNEQSKKEKQPKKTNGQKRLIAGYISMYCFVAMATSSIPGLIARNIYDKDIRILDDEQNAIYEQFMACNEFSETFKAEFTKVSNDYANGLISYEEFDEKVKHLNSVKYAQEVLSSSNNSLKSQAEEIEQKKEERREEYSSNPVVDISLGGMIAGGTASIASATASMIYSLKESAEEKRKKKLLTNKPGVIEPYKKTTYYVYDHKKTKTPNTIEEESNEENLTK